MRDHESVVCFSPPPHIHQLSNVSSSAKMEMDGPGQKIVLSVIEKERAMARCLPSSCFQVDFSLVV